VGKLYINRDEVLRYLGSRGQRIEDNMNLLIDECIEEIKEYINFKYTYKIFDIKLEDEYVKLPTSNLTFKGSDIKHHLKNSSKCVVMAATLGSLVDTKIRYYEKINLTKSLILDACATTAVEWVCDEVENIIKRDAEKEGYGITYRYSPGYGDLPIDIQPEILSNLEAQKKIGLTATETNILIPRKSVTAIVGFQDKDIVRQHPGCTQCSRYKQCGYRKGGNYCGS
jgi:hypothetical protein